MYKAPPGSKKVLPTALAVGMKIKTVTAQLRYEWCQIRAVQDNGHEVVVECYGARSAVRLPSAKFIYARE